MNEALACGRNGPHHPSSPRLDLLLGECVRDVGDRSTKQVSDLSAPGGAGIGGIAHRSSIITVVPLPRVARTTWTIIVGKDAAIMFAFLSYMCGVARLEFDVRSRGIGGCGNGATVAS
jgi:hypothetical protein